MDSLGLTAGQREVPADTVQVRFERQAARSPDAVAVRCGAERLTYAELDHRAADLAERLRERGAGRESVVGVCLDRGVNLPVALLGVVKAGAAFLPLDPSYPAERRGYMLADAGAALLVDDAGASEVPGQRRLGREDRPGSSGPVRRENLLYVIYTSGSTGTPKGVAVPHRALLSLFDWYWQDTKMSAGDVQLAAHSISFDPAVLELFFPLLNGASVVIATDQARLDPDALLDLIHESGVTVINVVPSHLNRLLDSADASARMSGLRLVVCGGERLSRALCDRFIQAVPGTRLANHYGPTETTIFATSWDCAEAHGASVPIGRPVLGVVPHVVDELMRPMPAGLPGELFLGGTGLARGYVNLPRLTATAFVADPFSNEPGGRLYRTGDVVRVRDDGALEFLGRADEQVKIRGFRIELGEVEAAIASNPAVREAAVVVRTGQTGEPVLAAFAEHDGTATADGLDRYLRGRLPDYMVPGYLELADALPHGVTGKVDKARLPELPVGDSVGPRDEREAVIAAIWASVLGLPSAGIHDDFFALGGDSLLATRVVGRLRQAFGVPIPLIALLENRSVAALAEVVARAEGQA